MELQEKHLWEPTQGKMRCSGKIYWDTNKSHPLGSQYLISVQVVQHHPAVEKVQPDLH